MALKEVLQPLWKNKNSKRECFNCGKPASTFAEGMSAAAWSKENSEPVFSGAGTHPRAVSMLALW